MNYASAWKRFGAILIDFFVSLPLGFAIGFLFVTWVGTSVNPLRLDAQLNAVGMIASWMYFACMESSKLQGTLGKMAFGLKVCDLEGNRVGFLKASGRHWGKWISALLLLIGFLMIFVTKKKQGLHDLMAGCVVLDGSKAASELRIEPDNPNNPVSSYQPVDKTEELVSGKTSISKLRSIAIRSKADSISMVGDGGDLAFESSSVLAFTDEELWAHALTEFESESRRRGLWAKSFSASGGNESLAMASYLKSRFFELQVERQTELANQEKMTREEQERVKLAGLSEDERAYVLQPKGQCPNCDALIPLTSETCPKCQAMFGPKAAWNPKPLREA
jgi:uncharacterized RDD family membrane protein YckC